MKHLEISQELQEKALLFAIGALPEDERRDYARHLEQDGCEVCLAESLELQSVAQTLALSLPPETPSADIKARLMAGVRAEDRLQVLPVKPLRRWNGWAWAGWGVAAAMAGMLVLLLSNNATLKREVQSLALRVKELEGQVTRDGVLLASLRNPQTRVLNLAGQGSTPGARGRIFWNEADGLWYVDVASLPQVSADKAYQLWFVPQQGNPISASVFNTGADGSAMLDIKLPASATALKAAAVTTEPAGGLPQPSGAFVLLGGD
jgi:anti-sigma-K factor RskA